jgi:hypothetical protein
MLRRLWKLLEAASVLAWLLSLGGGTVISVLVAYFAGFASPWNYFLFAGLLLLLTATLMPLGSRAANVLQGQIPHAERRDEVRKAPPKRQRWEAHSDVTQVENPGDERIIFDLRSRVGAQMIRGLACDVQSPLGGVPSRAVTRGEGGPCSRTWFTYPDEFDGAMGSLVPGTYRAIWYEFDEDWLPVEVARDEIEIPKREEQAEPRAFQ